MRVSYVISWINAESAVLSFTPRVELVVSSERQGVELTSTDFCYFFLCKEHDLLGHFNVSVFQTMTALEECLVSPRVELRPSVATRSSFIGDGERVILPTCYLSNYEIFFTEVHQLRRHELLCRFSDFWTLPPLTAPGPTPGKNSALSRKHHCVEEGTRHLNDVVLEKLSNHSELCLGVKNRLSFKA